MFTRRIYTCFKSIPGFEQTQVFIPDDISGPVAPGAVQPSGRAQLEADLERSPRRPLVEECHRHRGPAPKNRHHWPEKKLNRGVSKYGALFCVQHFFGTLAKDLSSYFLPFFCCLTLSRHRCPDLGWSAWPAPPVGPAMHIQLNTCSASERSLSPDWAW